VGLVIGAAATVFGYSNLTSVNVRWSILHVDGVPLWTVAVVPLAIVLIAGTVYHWMDGLHHFSEHMRHRHRVHELEAEVAALRGHLDQVLEMPDQSTSRLQRKAITTEPLQPVAKPLASALPELLPEPAVALANGATKPPRRRVRAKRVTLAVAAEPATTAIVTTNGGPETAVTEPAPKA
jgi:hypothetical protein